MIGKTISHYKITEKLGEGGMGVVYRAQDTSLNRFVALKFLPSHLIKDKATRKRFIVEAQAASALDHPNICTIHEVNETPDGQLYICMAYYEGESLKQKIKNNPIPFDEAVNICFHIALGLKAAHDEQIIHRDIKPGNIILTDKSVVKIVDFGLAKLAGVDLTKSTSSMGTIAYMCPEQIRGQKVDHRWDVWAIGIVFYEMLTGHLPFKGEYPEAIIYNIINDEPNLLSQYLDNLSNDVQICMDKFLKKSPGKRYQNMSEVIIDLNSMTKINGTVVKIVKPDIHQREGNKIAVIPLDNISSDTEQEWFADGMTDAMTTGLAQISGLRVISRSSAMQYKGGNKVPKQIASDLNVQYLVDGSVVKKGDLVKVSARLIDALEDEYIWAKEYEREFTNILGLQGEIATTIASQIEVQLTPQEEKRLAEKRPVNPETYELYMKGMYHLNKLTPDDVKKGLSYLQQAVENNPKEPLAHAGIAIANFTAAHGSSYSADILSKIKTATMKALKLDKSLPEAHLASTMVEIFCELDWKSALQSNKRALELNPNLALAHYFYGFLLRIPGDFEESHAELIRAKQLDPLNPVYTADLGWLYYMDEKFDESIEECLLSLDINPQFPQAYHILGHANAAKGMYEEAITNNQKAGELSFDWKWGLAHTYALIGFTDEALKIVSELEKRNLPYDSWCLASVYAGLGDKENVFYWLEQAYKQHHPFILWMDAGNKQYFSAFKEDPRFKDLAQRMKLPE
jgi:serine/threonine protein kinase